MDQKYKVTIVTCVYNRAHTIERVFRSMKSQTYGNIEHIIIDDGSTDELDPLVNKYISEVSFPVIYIKKENGGKHTATNVAWDNACGDFIINLDSDDELYPHAVEFLVNTYDAIPDDRKADYWCVHGRCCDQISNQFVGDPYPDGINDLPADKARAIAKTISGDKIGMMKREYLDKFRFPEPEAVTFVTESYIWSQLNSKYRTWYTNEIIRIYYIDEGDCLSRPKKSRQTYANKAFWAKFMLEKSGKLPVTTKKYLRFMIGYPICFEMSTKEYKKAHGYFLSSKHVLLNVYLSLAYLPAKAVSLIKH